jgi:hypothetical protein
LLHSSPYYAPLHVFTVLSCSLRCSLSEEHFFSPYIRVFVCRIRKRGKAKAGRYTPTFPYVHSTTGGFLSWFCPSEALSFNNFLSSRYLTMRLCPGSLYLIAPAILGLAFLLVQSQVRSPKPRQERGRSRGSRPLLGLRPPGKPQGNVWNACYGRVFAPDSLKPRPLPSVGLHSCVCCSRTHAPAHSLLCAATWTFEIHYFAQVALAPCTLDYC